MSPLADATLRISIVLLIGLVVRAVLRRRSPALRHAVLAAAIVAAPLVAFVSTIGPGIPMPTRLAGTTMAIPSAEVAPTGASAMVDDGGTLAARPAAFDWRAVAIATWTTGAAIGFAWLMVAAVRIRRLAAASVVVTDPRWCQALDQACRDAGLTCPVRLLAAPRGLLLATWGWRRPCVLIPVSALAWTDTRVRTVLAHEIAHVARHDWLLQLLADGLRMLLWWNPLAWLASRGLRHDSELACDDAVLRAGVGPTAYAEDLLQIARFVAPGAAPAAMVMRMARVSTLESRIVAMLNPTLDRRLPSRRALAGAALGLVIALLPVALVRAAQAGRQPLEGVVYDATGAVLPGVEVTLEIGSNPSTPPEMARKLEARSDAAGRFTFGAVDPGKYVLEVGQPGFRKLRQPLDLKQDGDWDRNVTLQVGDVKETIMVRERRPAAPTPIAAAGNAPTPVRVGGNIRAPRKTVNVAPAYPERMRDAGLEGQVPIEALIGVDGRVTSVRVATAQIHPDFATAAIDAVRQWRFEPTLLNGKPVEVVMTVSVTFSLE
jgi:TonB family protein